MQSGARGRGRARGRARAAQGAAEEPTESARPGAAGEPGTQVIACSVFLLVDKRRKIAFSLTGQFAPVAKVPIGPWPVNLLELLVV